MCGIPLFSRVGPRTPWLVAQAISEIVPDGDKENQRMQGLLNQRDKLEPEPGMLFQAPTHDAGTGWKPSRRGALGLALPRFNKPHSATCATIGG